MVHASGPASVQIQLVSEKYLSRLVLDLRRAKLIRSVRGSKGGFYLARSPETITLLEILETMEGPISVVSGATSPEKCNRQALCPMRNVWQRLNENIRDVTEGITLEDILDSYRTQNAEEGFYDYCI